MDKDELLERYEAIGEESDFLAARPLFERDLREQERRGQPDPLLLRQYGYLLECHGRLTIRRAVEQYERAIALDPDADKVQYQWIGAKASLGEHEDVIAVYRKRVAASPGSVRDLRFLARAYLSARDIDAAAEIIDAGRALAPNDWSLTADRGEVRAARGDAEGALTDWRRAHELDPEDLSTIYSSAFLLEREGRLAEAAEAWRYILEFNTTRGWELTAIWPRQELERLRTLLTETALHDQRFHDQDHLSSPTTHGFLPGLSRFARAETRICEQRRPPCLLWLDQTEGCMLLKSVGAVAASAYERTQLPLTILRGQQPGG